MRTHHVIDGPARAPVIVLAHSLGVTCRLWDATATALRDRFRVLRYDVRGHGASEVPPGPYTLEQMAGDVRELLDRLGIDAVHVVGQGIPEALNDQLAHDETGRRLAATPMDYALATAADAPREFVIRHLESPTPLNPLGAKGAGEGGIMPVDPLIAQAVEDTFAPFGARVTRVPVTRAELCAVAQGWGRS